MAQNAKRQIIKQLKRGDVTCRDSELQQAFRLTGVNRVAIQLALRELEAKVEIGSYGSNGKRTFRLKRR